MTPTDIVFWSAFGFVAYTYAGYPLVLWALSRCVRAPADPPAPAGWPEVTVVIAVHNEARRVRAKIANLRALDYPSGRMKILIVSDGSTDATVALLAAEPGVRMLRYAARRGKPYALNLALATVDTPVVVFADVRQQIAPDALRRLVARLMRPGVGAVSGELVHRDPRTGAAAQIGLYWRYEKWIRRNESRLASTVGVTGALYAMRRDDYTPLPSDTVLDDLMQPMFLVRRGQRVVFESRALVYDELESDLAGERRRKLRTLAGNFQAFVRHPWLFSPRANPIFLQFVSHKVFRLFVPYALAAMFAASALSDRGWLQAAALAQLLFYAVSIAAMKLPALQHSRAASFGAVFVDLNWTAVLALRNYLTGRVDARWEKS